MRPILVLTLGLVAGTWASAQMTVPSAGVEEGLSAAQRDFETVKALTEGTTVAPKNNLPSIGTPSLDTSAVSGSSSGSGNGAQKQPKKSGREKKSANWLVDAMSQEAATTLVPGSIRPRARGDLTRYDPTLTLAGASTDTDVADATDFFAQLQPPPKAPPRASRDEPATVNPLNSYLSDWLSTQDYALLKPAPTAAVISGTLGADKASASAAPARENPYLQALAPPPVPAAPPVGEKAPPPPAVTQGMVAPAPPPPATPPGHVPDFARPAADEKYFKQLKRF